MTNDLPAGLIWYPDDRPGITRRRAGRGWSYSAPDGTTIDDAAERKRISMLGIPPAYEKVWISPKPAGHLQATGRDAAQRKQYRYHQKLSEYRARTKFDGLAEFGAALPSIRRSVGRALAGSPNSQDFAIATVLRLLDRASLRVGSPDNAADRNVFGATTLRTRHLNLSNDAIRLRYRGKGGKIVRKTIRDKTLQTALHRMDDLPGGALIQWIDDDGAARTVGPGHVNAWLQQYAPDATAKTFRTWNGSVAALEVAMGAKDHLTIKEMVEKAAERLHNTPLIARKSYVHPDVIALADQMRDLSVPDAPHGLRNAERVLLRLLKA